MKRSSVKTEQKTVAGTIGTTRTVAGTIGTT